MTWSLSVIASQLIIWITERKVNKPNDIASKYPVGKTRLEPVGILTVSILMIMLSVTVIRESTQALIEQTFDVEWSITALILLSGT